MLSEGLSVGEPYLRIQTKKPTHRKKRGSFRRLYNLKTYGTDILASCIIAELIIQYHRGAWWLCKSSWTYKIHRLCQDMPSISTKLHEDCQIPSFWRFKTPRIRKTATRLAFWISLQKLIFTLSPVLYVLFLCSLLPHRFFAAFRPKKKTGNSKSENLEMPQEDYTTNLI